VSSGSPSVGSRTPSAESSFGIATISPSGPSSTVTATGSSGNHIRRAVGVTPGSRTGMTRYPSRDRATANAFSTSRDTHAELTVAGLITTTTCAASAIAFSISGASRSPPRRLRESTHTGTPCASSRRRNSATKTSSADAWEMKTSLTRRPPRTRRRVEGPT
jgi:hypothetical protein